MDDIIYLCRDIPWTARESDYSPCQNCAPGVTPILDAPENLLLHSNLKDEPEVRQERARRAMRLLEGLTYRLTVTLEN